MRGVQGSSRPFCTVAARSIYGDEASTKDFGLPAVQAPHVDGRNAH